ncbi:abc transporter [Lucifera butyrica]|uniref:Abc transporter n=1 Tax=Lucifera butyrica TaxID=1351585 RepID=A0A498R698_9FIRM|nr:ATP-binding cassette domain-containing protein [Lucifera butyrica]VBB08286.1 abc transporter [Lucifera butyrica]
MQAEINGIDKKNLVEAFAVSCTYHAGDSCVAAVADVSCAIAAGQRIALVGASGSGKTSLLHLLGGLISPTAGTVRWPAMETKQANLLRSRSFIFQNPSLLPPLTILENTELPMLLTGEGEALARLRAQNELEQVGMIALANKLPEELSGGQAQRVAAARALSIRPALLLADEPTGQLDRQTGLELIDRILRAADYTGAAVIIATHDEDVAARMQRIWRMSRGKLEVDH